MVLASKVHPIALKFLSKEGHHFESYLAAWPLVRGVKLENETSGRFNVGSIFRGHVT